MSDRSADAITRHLILWAEAEPAIRCVILTSSRANGDVRVDLLSDYDVILAVTNIEPFFSDRTWLEEFGAVLVLYRDPIQDEFGHPRFRYITQYEDGTKIDFTLWPVELLTRVTTEPLLPDELDVGYRVLLDKDGLTSRLAPATRKAHIPSPPSRDEFNQLVEEFFHESTYVAKHLWRGDLMPAKYNLDHAMKQVHLRKLLEWRIEMDHDWSIKPGDYGKGLNKLVSPDVWNELQRTYAGASIEDNWNALFDTIELFRKVAIAVADGMGYAYPSDLHERVTAYLKRVRGLRSV